MESKMDQIQEAQERQVAELIFNWINLGYNRESCIRMTEAQGFSHRFAIKVVDETFAQMSENYDLCYGANDAIH